MPYTVVRKGRQYCVFTEGPDGKPTGDPHGCHKTVKEARAQQSALNAAAPPKGESKELSLSKKIDTIRSAFYASGPFCAPSVISSNSISDTPTYCPAFVREIFDDYLIADHDKEGKTYKVPYGKGADGAITFGEPIEVEMLWSETKERDPGRAVIFKDKTGSYRWVAWVSNKYRDNDDPPEILSSKAHKEFVAWADKTKNYPELWIWHVPGTKSGKADWLEFADGFLIASGLFDKGKEKVAERLLAYELPLGVSHGLKRLKHNAKDVVTDSYRSHEISFLPKSREANPFTDFLTIAKEAQMLSKAKKQFLSQFLDDKDVAAIESNTSRLKEIADAAGVDYKELEAGLAAEDAATEEAEEAESTAEEAKGLPEGMNVKELAASLVDTIADAFGLKELSETIVELKGLADRVPALENTIKGLQGEISALKAEDDEKVAKALAPKAAPIYSWMNGGHQASKSKDTIVGKEDPDAEMVKSRQGSAFANFLSRVTS